MTRRLVRTVARRATPKLAPTWRPALEMALARPISWGLIVAKVAVCSETSMNEKKQPRTNMMPRIHQRFVPTSTKAKANVVSVTPARPVIIIRRGPTRE